MIRVGIGDTEPAENQPFGIFHTLSFGVMAMIKAGQMQNAVHNKVRGVMKDRLLLGQGFLRDGLISECHIAQKSNRCA
jgi:hypothetical protein